MKALVSNGSRLCALRPQRIATSGLGLPSAFVRAFTIPFDSIKVLIVGQDPYPTPGHPVGLSFCVAPNVHPLPKSLVNIYKELVDDLGAPMPTNGDLTPWTERGVMLLNRCLTVGVGRPNSHQGKGWEEVTEAAIRALNARRILWLAGSHGRPAAFSARRKSPIWWMVGSTSAKAWAHPGSTSSLNGLIMTHHCSQTCISGARGVVWWTDELFADYTHG